MCISQKIKHTARFSGRHDDVDACNSDDDQNLKQEKMDDFRMKDGEKLKTNFEQPAPTRLFLYETMIKYTKILF